MLKPQQFIMPLDGSIPLKKPKFENQIFKLGMAHPAGNFVPERLKKHISSV
jgi:hypothetical protein